MHVLSIDVGSYSVKYISSFVEKRKVNHVEMSEIVLKDYLSDNKELKLIDAQIAIVHEIIENTARPDSRVIFQVNNEILTNRFLTLPVKSKKKAELMLPFQLEEDIPFGLSEIHYAYRMEQAKSQYFALASLVKETNFTDFYNGFKDANSLPNILTSEASIMENFYNQTPIAGPFCVLDIGHKTTKAYFFYNSRLLVTHVSYVGGSDVNEMISKSYKIDIDEAIIYKHQNAFFLNSTSSDSVDQATREFAIAMDHTFAPLVSDFLRWKIGLKVNFGLSLQHVYLIGGSANIKNIANYLTEKWETKVVLAETFDKIESEKIDLNPKNKSKYALVNMMAIGMRRKNRFMNFLTGKFAQASSVEIPIHSFSFIGIRVAAVFFVLMLSLIAERFFIQKDIQFVNAKLTSLLKNETLAINGRLRRAVATNPKPLLDSLVKRQRSIRQEISTIQSAIEIKALQPLVQISQLASSTQATLIDFNSSEVGEVTALFSAETADELNNLKAALERSNLADVVVEVDPAKLQLKMTASGE